MIKIATPHLEELAQKHYEALKSKIKFPTCKYSLEEVITAKPDKLHEIAMHYKDNHKFDVMRKEYKKFTVKTDNDTYDAYTLAQSLNVTVCPYCNRNYTFTVRSKNGSTRPQFDHFYDKATYPILALSFYNLIPSCPTCNASIKGRKEFSLTTHVHPYVEGFDDKARFALHVKDSSFYYDEKGFDLEFGSNDAKEQKNIDDFALEEIYKNHKDIVLELIQKSVMYNESYIEELMKNYEGTLFKNEEDLLRLIFGGYISDEDLGKRPLSKLTKDILEQLEII
ncbi:hypothetical protein [Sulfurospirillum multivorans]|uniref:HNH domain-containing protein n=2 Tax=Sulfurospirillum multivorans TaxID=66821 RepID=A0AA86AME3_SULMK|nr:hypothetical protein [Sulfurospirillum multivorans]AHJ13475.1 hypothetical protein SMUL_2222 [Sulfurospirillum multivorans DSM 12446]QEH06965.1 hypothetical protein SMN_2200 [Sulfurospirillum multivorans]